MPKAAIPAATSVAVPPPCEFAAGSQAELAMPELGMQGSWYPVAVQELLQGGTVGRVAIGGLYNAARPDTDLCEEHPTSLLRPPAPPTPENFCSQLKVGGLAELWYQQGWWQVTVKQLPADGAEWVLESVQFGTCHRLPTPALRPCWRWTPSGSTPWTAVETI
jgi:hypothetical protein